MDIKTLPLKGFNRPIVFFDLESTGLLVELDRIIEISLLKIFPDGRETLSFTQRFDPGIKIPMESTAIHKIYNHDLVGQPRFSEMASQLFEIFSDADLGGFAMLRLDIPLLTREFDRAGYKFSMEGRRIADASTIFREKERRNLSAAYKFYCGKDLVGAHGAQADNEAALQVFLAQLERYPDLPRDMAGLHALCFSTDPCNVDREGKLVWRDGEAFFNFGKHRYKSLAEVAKIDGEYIDWITNKGDFSNEFVDICLRAKQGLFPRREAPPRGKPA